MKIDNRISFINKNRTNQQTKNISKISFAGNLDYTSLNTQKAKRLLALGSILSLIGGIFLGNMTKNANINYSNENQKNNSIIENKPEEINIDSLKIDTTDLKNQTPLKIDEEIITLNN